MYFSSIHSKLLWSSSHAGIFIHTHAHMLVRMSHVYEIHGASVYSLIH